jgi:TonB-dependent starch-binding outer membrane protein SusC
MKYKLFKSVLFFVVAFGFQFAAAQTVTGKVWADGQPLPGASVTVKGTSKGTSTGFDGSFKLENVSAGSKLTISYLGYVAREVNADLKAPMNVTLNEDKQKKELETIVITGYGSSKKKDVNGAITTIKASALKDQPVVSLDQALIGKVAGVNVTQNSGAPGGGISMRIRGVASISGSNEPLYVLDGVPLENPNNQTTSFAGISGGTGQTVGNALSGINPSDIESIDILKDAAAQAIYGSRAANGVVIVTTKKGKKGKSTIAYDGYTAFQEVARTIPVLNLQEYGQYFNAAATINNLSYRPEFLTTDNLGKGTNWQKEVFRQAPIISHQVSMSGGNEKIRYYTSLNYFDQEGIVINTDFNRIGMRANIEASVNDWFKVGNNINFSITNENASLFDNTKGVISQAIRYSPGVPVRFSDGSFSGPITGDNLSGLNPVATAEIRNSNTDRKRINGNLFGDFKIAKDLTFRTDIGYEFSTSKSSSFLPSYNFGPLLKVDQDQTFLNITNADNFSWVFKNYFNYNKAIGKNDFNFLLGQEASKSTYNGVISGIGGFKLNDQINPSLGDRSTSTVGGYEGAFSLSSYFSRLNYNYDSRYYLTAVIRADASSRFGANNRWGYFPSISGAWTVSNEEFLKDKKGLSLLKLRASYGAVGNTGSDINSIFSRLATQPTDFGVGTVYYSENIPNPNVKWETTKSADYGVEFGLFNDRIRLDFDYYTKNIVDFLIRLPVNPIQAGNVLQNPLTNLGELENKGIDITLNTRNFTGTNFTWDTTITYGSNKNVLKSLNSTNTPIFAQPQFGDSNFVPLTITRVGSPIGQFYGLVTDGIIRTSDELNAAPVPVGLTKGSTYNIGDIRYKSINGDNVIDDNDRTIIGNPVPKFTCNMINNFKIYDFDLSVALQGVYGNDIYNYLRRSTEDMTTPYSNQVVAVKDSYTFDLNGSLPRYGGSSANIFNSDRYVEDGSFLRIQNVTLGYRIPNAFISRQSFFSKARIYGSIQNLHTFTKYSGLDPDVGSFNQNALLTGVDVGRYPVARTVTFGINLEF